MADRSLEGGRNSRKMGKAVGSWLPFVHLFIGVDTVALDASIDAEPE
jgi:hypothetical protein